MRQTDLLPIMDKCNEQTFYYNQIEGGTTRLIYKTCVYLENGKCTLNGCIKNYGRGKNGYREDNS